MHITHVSTLRFLATKAGLPVALTALAGLLVALTGCASVPRQAFDPSAGAVIKKIVVRLPPEPAEYEVRNISMAAPAFGLIGALANVADNESMSSDLTALMKTQRFQPARLLSRAIVRELEKRGYAATVAPLAVPDAAAGKPADDAFFSGLAADVDAVLVPAIKRVGYVSLAGSRSYTPYVTGNVQLFSTAGRARRYFQGYSYGWDLKNEDIEYLAPAQEYMSFDAVTASAHVAQGGIEDGLASIAALVGQQLGKAPSAAPAPAPAPASAPDATSGR